MNDAIKSLLEGVVMADDEQLVEAMHPAYLLRQVDAAHVIHPLAGQGLNLGLKDVAALAEILVDAMRLGLDHGAPEILDRYQRWRRFDTSLMAAVTDNLNRLFSNDVAPVRAVRDVGLGLVDRMAPIKHVLISRAAGLESNGPRLTRGMPL